MDIDEIYATGRLIEKKKDNPNFEVVEIWAESNKYYEIGRNYDKGESILLSETKYWKVLKYKIDREHNPRYPVHAFVKIYGENTEHFWMLPEEVLGSEDYDWTTAEQVDDLWG